jgi:predicted oxidoreductase
MDVHEVARVFQDLMQTGKIRAFGVSNFSPSAISLLQSEINISANQIECSLTHFEPMLDGSLDFQIQNKLVTMAWKPLGDIVNSSSERGARLRSVIDETARKYECSPSQLAIAWLCQHPAQIVPVIGTTSVERMEQAVVATEIKLEIEDWFKLLETSQGHKVP